jgi:hypothetical protein
MAMAAICFGAILIGTGGYLVSIKEDQPNYKLQHNAGIGFLVVGLVLFLGGLFVEVSDYMYSRSMGNVYVRPTANNGGRNAIIPPAPPRNNYANRMQNAQYGANRAMLQAQAGNGNRMQYWQGH